MHVRTVAPSPAAPDGHETAAALAVRSTRAPTRITKLEMHLRWERHCHVLRRGPRRVKKTWPRPPRVYVMYRFSILIARVAPGKRIQSNHPSTFFFPRTRIRVGYGGRHWVGVTYFREAWAVNEWIRLGWGWSLECLAACSCCCPWRQLLLPIQNNRKMTVSTMAGWLAGWPAACWVTFEKRKRKQRMRTANGARPHSCCVMWSSGPWDCMFRHRYTSSTYLLFVRFSRIMFRKSHRTSGPSGLELVPSGSLVLEPVVSNNQHQHYWDLESKTVIHRFRIKKGTACNTLCRSTTTVYTNRSCVRATVLGLLAPIFSGVQRGFKPKLHIVPGKTEITNKPRIEHLTSWIGDDFIHAS